MRITYRANSLCDLSGLRSTHAVSNNCLMSANEIEHLHTKNILGKLQRLIQGDHGTVPSIHPGCYANKNGLSRHCGQRYRLATVLSHFCATRRERVIFHRNKLEVETAAKKPYEINSLLRYPIIQHGDELYCPHPQLIGYAATRGLFFKCCDEDGE